MRDRPHAAALLEIARTTLLRELLDALPAEHRYSARMIANAMGIAAREHAAGCEPLRRELMRLCRLLEQSAPQLHQRAALEHALEEHNRELAKRLRGGRFDSAHDPRRALWEHLLATTRDKLEESNPKYLRARGL